MSYDLLIVDDQAGIRRLLWEVFIEEGLEVDMAASGAEAIRKVVSQKPRLILLDSNMPEMSGLETAAKIRELNLDTIIMMVSAFDDTFYISKAKDLGINYYLNKPFDIISLRSMVRDILKGIKETEVAV
ncbi:MAG TPA: two-component system response regulator [Desulfotomaculum sp.]|nr:MAG: Response regulator with CheY-like receiver, AAA-type ATPase, and DNA-binding domain [Desulfotomaculum sp. 46_80]HAG11679.1 two-component system response regulator [Desulfotomaculum sp.]HBY05048.1 two-component system response regulator [Desulfotomaculum sp.]